MRSFLVVLMLFVSVAISRRSALADDYPMTPNAPIKPMEMVLIKGGCFKMGDTFAGGEHCQVDSGAE